MSAAPPSAIFIALANPTRQAILTRLAVGETSVSELAQPFNISPPTVTGHLKVLQRAGLIPQGKKRPMAALQAEGETDAGCR